MRETLDSHGEFCGCTGNEAFMIRWYMGDREIEKFGDSLRKALEEKYGIILEVSIGG